MAFILVPSSGHILAMLTVLLPSFVADIYFNHTVAKIRFTQPALEMII